jgi:uncharacterized protein YkwD
MSRLLGSRWLVVTASLAIAAVTLLGHSEAASAAFPVPGDLAIIQMVAAEQALMDLTNADRVSNGLSPLEFDPETLEIARTRAQAQLGPGNLSHYDSEGFLAFVKLLDAAKVEYSFAGENLARNGTAQGDAIVRIQQSLMKSPTHRKNILDERFARVAIGAAQDATGRIAFAEIFRSR